MKIRTRWIAFLLLCTKAAGAASCIELPQCHLAEVFINALASLDRISTQFDVENRSAKNGLEQMANSIHASRAIIIQLQSNVNLISSIPTEGDTVNIAADIFSRQIPKHERLIEIATEFMSGPKPGVDYGALSAEVPQIRAELEATKKLYMTLSNFIFANMIDKRPDSANHMSRLVIDREQRRSLIARINSAFGKKLEAKNQNWFVSAGWIMRNDLQQGHSASDQPSK